MATNAHEVELIIKANNLSNQTLKEVSAAVDNLSNSITKQVTAASKGEGSLKNLNKSYRDLEDAGKALVSQQALIDRFKRIADAVETAGQKATSLRTKFEALAEQQSFQGQVTKKQDAELAKLAASADKADKAFDREKASLASLSAGLEKAGIDTKNFEAAQARISSTATQVAASLKKVREAQDNGPGSTPRTNFLNPFEDNGRTTLSLIQRIRGEILALGAAYVGLQGAIQGFASVIDVVKTQQQVQSKLLAVAGNDAKAAGDEYAYLVGQAERLGIFLPDLAKTYSSFAIAAKAANMNTQQMRFVFERVAEAGKVMHLNDEDMKGIFNAITQMVSKGKIQSEELRGQLGDRLPGAIAFAAKKYEGGVKEFVKQLEKGNIEATSGVINLARGLDDAFNKQLAGATNSVESQEARFKNALFEFKKQIADAGVGNAYGELITRLTEFFRSEDGKRFADDLAAGFRAVSDSLKFLIDNLETVKKVVEAGALFLISKQAFSAVTGLANATKQVLELNKALKEGTAQVSALQKSFLLLNSFMVGFEIGGALNDKFEVVRQIGVSLVTGFEEIWTRIKFGAQIAWESIFSSWQDTSVLLLNAMSKVFREILELMQKAAKAVGADGLAANIGNTIDALTLKQSEATRSRVTALREEMQKELQRIRDIGFDMFKDASDAARKAQAELEKQRNARTPAGTTADPGGNPAVFGISEEEAKRMAAAYRSLLGEIEGLEAQSMRKQKESIDSITASLDKQYNALFIKIRDANVKSVSELAAVVKKEGLDKEFAELFRQLNEQGIKGAGDLEVRLKAAVDVLKKEAIEKYAKEQLDKVESIKKAFAEVETKIGKGRDATLAQRFTAIDDTYASLYTKITELDQEHQGNLKQQLDLLIAQLKVVEQQKFAQDQVVANEKKVSDIVSSRDDRIRVINDLTAAGLKSQAQAREDIKKIIEETQPTLEEQAKKSKEIVESLKDSLTPEQYDAAIAKIDLAVVSADKYKTSLYDASQANKDLAAGLTNALSQAADGFGQAIVGAKSFGDAVRGAGRAFLQFAADFLRKIAEMIVQQIILNSISGGTAGGGAGGFISSLVAHEGGVVGSSTNRGREVSPSWFSNAPKYHTGGISGLAPSEYPAILQKGEEVLTRNDPRHILNGGGAGGAPQPVVQDVKVVNMVDSSSVVSEGLSTPQGVKTIINVIRANRNEFKAVLG